MLGKMLQPQPRTSRDFAAPYLRAAHIQPHGRIVEVEDKTMWFSPEEMSAQELQPDDVVVVEGGAGFGRSAVVENSRPGWGFQNSIVRVRPRGGSASGRFLSFALQAALESGEVEVACDTATIPHFTAEKVAAFAVPAPPLHLQLAVADFLDRETAHIGTLIAEQQRLIDLLVERRSAVVDSVVTRGVDRAGPIKDSGVAWIGTIPRDWEVRPLWSMFRRIKDVDHPDEQLLSVFRDFGVVAKDSRDNINQTAENRSIYQLVHPGWLVTNRMKAWQGSVGISGLRGIVSGHYICFAPLHSEDHNYLNWLFRSPRYIAGYRLISRGVRIGQAEIDNDDYRLLPVVVPPIDEQRTIAAHLGAEMARIDNLTAATAKMIDLAQERRAALIMAAVTGQIDVRDMVA